MAKRDIYHDNLNSGGNPPMDRVAAYRQIIKDLIAHYAKIKPAYAAA